MQEDPAGDPILLSQRLRARPEAVPVSHVALPSVKAFGLFMISGFNEVITETKFFLSGYLFYAYLPFLLETSLPRP